MTGFTVGDSNETGCDPHTSAAPEKVYSWTPSRSGSATFSTCGTGTKFDTVLYIRTGVCRTGTQIACNDDTPTCGTGDGCNTADHHGSKITLTVTAGTTYYVIVDGFDSSCGGDGGSFSLLVTPPPVPTTTTTTRPSPLTTTTRSPTTTTSTTRPTTTTVVSTTTSIPPTTLMPACPRPPNSVVRLEGFYNNRVTLGDSQLREAMLVDARGGVFLTSASNLVPLKLDRGSGYFNQPARQEPPDICISGPTFQGNFARTETWAQSKAHAGAVVEFWPRRLTIDSLRADNVHDGIRPQDGNDWTVQNSWLSFVRDDCIENDHMRSGLVQDSFFDGCYVFLSSRPSSTILSEGWTGVDEVITVDATIVRMQDMPGPDCVGATGWGNTWKWDDLGPKLIVTNSVFRYESLGCGGTKSVELPIGKLASCDNNVIVWKGTGPFPGHLPSCFSVTTDDTFWQNAVEDWKLRHPNVT